MPLKNITVVNRKALPERTPNTFRVKIDRPSPLGCPFIIGIHGTRAEVIAQYQLWLAKINPECPKRHLLMQEINLIRRACLKGLDVELVCNCAPLPCHGDIIKTFIENWEIL